MSDSATESKLRVRSELPHFRSSIDKLKSGLESFRRSRQAVALKKTLSQVNESDLNGLPETKDSEAISISREISEVRTDHVNIQTIHESSSIADTGSLISSAQLSKLNVWDIGEGTAGEKLPIEATVSLEMKADSSASLPLFKTLEAVDNTFSLGITAQPESVSMMMEQTDDVDVSAIQLSSVESEAEESQLNGEWDLSADENGAMCVASAESGGFEESRLSEENGDLSTDDDDAMSMAESLNSSLLSHLDNLLSMDDDSEYEVDSESLEDGYYSSSSDDDSSVSTSESPKFVMATLAESAHDDIDQPTSYDASSPPSPVVFSEHYATMETTEVPTGGIHSTTGDEVALADISKIEFSNSSVLSCLEDLLSPNDSETDSESEVLDAIEHQMEKWRIPNVCDVNPSVTINEASAISTAVLVPSALVDVIDKGGPNVAKDEEIYRMESTDSSFLSHLEELMSLASDSDDDQSSESIDNERYSSESELPVDDSKSHDDDSSLLSHLHCLCSSSASSVNSCSGSLDDNDDHHSFDSDDEGDNNHKPRVPSLNVMGREG